MNNRLRKATAIMLAVLMLCGAFVFALPSERYMKAEAKSIEKIDNYHYKVDDHYYISQKDLDSGCFICSYAMLVSNMRGRLITRDEVLSANGGGVSIINSNLKSGLKIDWIQTDMESYSNDQKISTVKNALNTHPYGVLLGGDYYYTENGQQKKSFHMIVARLDSSGNIIIDDSGRHSVNNGCCIPLSSAYGINSWDKIDQVRVVTSTGEYVPTPVKPYDETDSLGNDFYAHINVGPEHFIPTAVLSQKNIDANGNGVIEAATESKSAYYHKWHFKRTSDGKSFNIFDAVTGYAWQINTDTASAGNPVVLGAPDNPETNNRQKWYVYKKKESNLFYYIVPVTNGSVGAYAYDSSGNTLGNVVLRDLSETYDPSNKDKASYIFEYVYTSFTPDTPTKEDRQDLGNDFYATIKNSSNNRMVMNSPKLSEPHRIATAVEADDSLKQIWHFVRDDNNYYTIRSAYSEATADENDTELVNTSAAPGSHVFVLPENASENHKWYITGTSIFGNSQKTFEQCVLTREDTGLVLYSFEADTNCMQMAKYNPISNNQVFTITKVDAPSELSHPKLNISAIFAGKSDGTPAKIQITPKGSSETIEKDLPHSNDNGGELTISDLDKGEYSLKITKPGFLSYTKNNIDLQSGMNLSGIELYAGDVNSDNAINAKDQAAMTDAFGTTSSDAKYRRSADFNEDGRVNAADRSEIVRNFGKSSTVAD